MNTNRSLAAIGLMLLLLSYGCNTEHHSEESYLEEAKKAIAESNDIYFQAFVKGDSSIFIERYADDCCIMAPGAPALCGSDAALTFYKIAYNELGLRNG